MKKCVIYICAETQTRICVEHDQREKEDIQRIGKIVLMSVAFSFVLFNRTLNLEKVHLKIMMNFREYC
jgi:hypothetical protein